LTLQAGDDAVELPIKEPLQGLGLLLGLGRKEGREGGREGYLREWGVFLPISSNQRPTASAADPAVAAPAVAAPAILPFFPPFAAAATAPFPHPDGLHFFFLFGTPAPVWREGRRGGGRERGGAL